ncbi:hypothetical protein BB558_001631 [Smittium angustum]|uniref:Uncharacterized protein n=1 Tax=Smittium angustum TaxID=133377 RepID=A0A2U1JB56_SMIAN|nr:hypothetical protein BB558_001631 [Smittium angustum]
MDPSLTNSVQLESCWNEVSWICASESTNNTKNNQTIIDKISQCYSFAIQNNFPSLYISSTNIPNSNVGKSKGLKTVAVSKEFQLWTFFPKNVDNSLKEKICSSFSFKERSFGFLNWDNACAPVLKPKNININHNIDSIIDSHDLYEYSKPMQIFRFAFLNLINENLRSKNVTRLGTNKWLFSNSSNNLFSNNDVDSLKISNTLSEHQNQVNLDKLKSNENKLIPISFNLVPTPSGPILFINSNRNQTYYPIKKHFDISTFCKKCPMNVSLAPLDIPGKLISISGVESSQLKKSHGFHSHTPSYSTILNSWNSMFNLNIDPTQFAEPSDLSAVATVLIYGSGNPILYPIDLVYTTNKSQCNCKKNIFNFGFKDSNMENNLETTFIKKGNTNFEKTTTMKEEPHSSKNRQPSEYLSENLFSISECVAKIKNDVVKVSKSVENSLNSSLNELTTEIISTTIKNDSQKIDPSTSEGKLFSELIGTDSQSFLDIKPNPNYLNESEMNFNSLRNTNLTMNAGIKRDHSTFNENNLSEPNVHKDTLEKIKSEYKEPDPIKNTIGSPVNIPIIEHQPSVSSSISSDGGRIPMSGNKIDSFSYMDIDFKMGMDPLVSDLGIRLGENNFRDNELLGYNEFDMQINDSDFKFFDNPSMSGFSAFNSQKQSKLPVSSTNTITENNVNHPTLMTSSTINKVLGIGISEIPSNIPIPPSTLYTSTSNTKVSENKNDDSKNPSSNISIKQEPSTVEKSDDLNTQKSNGDITEIFSNEDILEDNLFDDFFTTNFEVEEKVDDSAGDSLYVEPENSFKVHRSPELKNEPVKSEYTKPDDIISMEPNKIKDESFSNEVSITTNENLQTKQSDQLQIDENDFDLFCDFFDIAQQSSPQNVQQSETGVKSKSNQNLDFVQELQPLQEITSEVKINTENVDSIFDSVAEPSDYENKVPELSEQEKHSNPNDNIELKSTLNMETPNHEQQNDPDQTINSIKENKVSLSANSKLEKNISALVPDEYSELVFLKKSVPSFEPKSSNSDSLTPTQSSPINSIHKTNIHWQSWKSQILHFSESNDENSCFDYKNNDTMSDNSYSNPNDKKYWLKRLSSERNNNLLENFPVPKLYSVDTSTTLDKSQSKSLNSKNSQDITETNGFFESKDSSKTHYWKDSVKDSPFYEFIAESEQEESDKNLHTNRISISPYVWMKRMAHRKNALHRRMLYGGLYLLGDKKKNNYYHWMLNQVAKSIYDKDYKPNSAVLDEMRNKIIHKSKPSKKHIGKLNLSPNFIPSYSQNISSQVASSQTLLDEPNFPTNSKPEYSSESKTNQNPFKDSLNVEHIFKDSVQIPSFLFSESCASIGYLIEPLNYIADDYSSVETYQNKEHMEIVFGTNTNSNFEPIKTRFDSGKMNNNDISVFSTEKYTSLFDDKATQYTQGQSRNHKATFLDHDILLDNQSLLYMIDFLSKWPSLEFSNLYSNLLFIELPKPIESHFEFQNVLVSILDAFTDTNLVSTPNKKMDRINISPLVSSPNVSLNKPEKIGSDNPEHYWAASIYSSKKISKCLSSLLNLSQLAKLESAIDINNCNKFNRALKPHQIVVGLSSVKTQQTRQFQTEPETEALVYSELVFNKDYFDYERDEVLLHDYISAMMERNKLLLYPPINNNILSYFLKLSNENPETMPAPIQIPRSQTIYNLNHSNLDQIPNFGGNKSLKDSESCVLCNGEFFKSHYLNRVCVDEKIVGNNLEKISASIQDNENCQNALDTFNLNTKKLNEKFDMAFDYSNTSDSIYFDSAYFNHNRENILSIDSSSLNWWSSLPLSPAGGQKSVLYCGISSATVSTRLSLYLDNVSSLYSSLLFGHHKPLNISSLYPLYEAMVNMDFSKNNCLVCKNSENIPTNSNSKNLELEASFSGTSFDMKPTFLNLGNGIGNGNSSTDFNCEQDRHNESQSSFSVATTTVISSYKQAEVVGKILGGLLADVACGVYYNSSKTDSYYCSLLAKHKLYPYQELAKQMMSYLLTGDVVNISTESLLVYISSSVISDSLPNKLLAIAFFAKSLETSYKNCWNQTELSNYVPILKLAFEVVNDTIPLQHQPTQSTNNDTNMTQMIKYEPEINFLNIYTNNYGFQCPASSMCWRVYSKLPSILTNNFARKFVFSKKLNIDLTHSELFDSDINPDGQHSIEWKYPPFYISSPPIFPFTFYLGSNPPLHLLNSGYHLSQRNSPNHLGNVSTLDSKPDIDLPSPILSRVPSRKLLMSLSSIILSPGVNDISFASISKTTSSSNNSVDDSDNIELCTKFISETQLLTMNSNLQIAHYSNKMTEKLSENGRAQSTTPKSSSSSPQPNEFVDKDDAKLEEIANSIKSSFSSLLSNSISGFLSNSCDKSCMPSFTNSKTIHVAYNVFTIKSKSNNELRQYAVVCWCSESADYVDHAIFENISVDSKTLKQNTGMEELSKINMELILARCLDYQNQLHKTVCGNNFPIRLAISRIGGMSTLEIFKWKSIISDVCNLIKISNSIHTKPQSSKLNNSTNESPDSNHPSLLPQDYNQNCKCYIPAFSEILLLGTHIESPEAEIFYRRGTGTQLVNPNNLELVLPFGNPSNYQDDLVKPVQSNSHYQSVFNFPFPVNLAKFSIGDFEESLIGEDHGNMIGNGSGIKIKDRSGFTRQVSLCFGYLFHISSNLERKLEDRSIGFTKVRQIDSNYGIANMSGKQGGTVNDLKRPVKTGSPVLGKNVDLNTYKKLKTIKSNQNISCLSGNVKTGISTNSRNSMNHQQTFGIHSKMVMVEMYGILASKQRCDGHSKTLRVDSKTIKGFTNEENNKESPNNQNFSGSDPFLHGEYLKALLNQYHALSEISSLKDIITASNSINLKTIMKNSLLSKININKFENPLETNARNPSLSLPLPISIVHRISVSIVLLLQEL